MKCANYGLENQLGLEFCDQCSKPREVAMRSENTWLGVFVVMGIVIVMGLLSFQFVNLFSEILHQLP